MQTIFPSLGITPLDFLQIAAGFLLVLALVLSDATRRHFLANFMHGVFALQCLLIIIFREGVTPKLFAGLMLFSTVIIRLVLARRTTEVNKRLST